MLVRHLLSHRAGLVAFREPTAAEELADWNLMITRLADTRPWWQPGTASGYHALTYGFLVGELIRRVTGAGVRDFLHREVADRAGADFRIGLSPADNNRVATLVQTAPEDPAVVQAMFAQLNPVALAVLTNPVVGPDQGNADWWRAAEIPAANGHATARAVASLYGAFAQGGVAGGQRLLSAAGSSASGRGRGPASTWSSGTPASAAVRPNWASGCGCPARTLTTGRTRAASGMTASAARSGWPIPRPACPSDA